MGNVKIYLVLFSSVYFAAFCRAETPSVLKLNLCDTKYDQIQNGVTYKNVCCGLNKNQIPVTSLQCKGWNKDIDKFRRDALYLHNYYRNSSATHRDSNLTTTRPGSNMNALSYDLDLEYLAWCNAIRCKYAHDKGHYLPEKFKGLGQNIGTQMSSSYAAIIKDSTHNIHNWWHENEFMLPGVLDEWDPKKKTKKEIGHYTQLVWWSVTHIGCARSSYFDDKEKDYNFYIVCNYGSKIAGSNIPGAVVYEKGPPCTDCQNVGTKCCNREFPGLCGPIAPIPTGWTPPDEIPAKRRRRASNLTFQEGEAQATTTTTTPEPPDFMLAAGVKAPECAAPASTPAPAPAPAPAQTSGPSGSQAITTESQPQDNGSHETTDDGAQAVNNAANSSSGAMQTNFHSANFIVFFIFVFGAVILY